MKRLRLSALLLAASALAVAALLLKAATAGPTADFSVSPPGPAVDQQVSFLDASGGSPTSWSWDFGDGTGSTEQNPLHTYAAPGPYVVTLTASDGSGSTQKSQSVFVTASDTLRLLSAHPFTVTLSARDQRTGNTASGFALPQTDVFGYFSLPGLTFNPGNPEVFLKILDGTTINGHFWVFYGTLTDVEYTLTITEEATGLQKTYTKPAGSARGGVDTSAFSGVSGVTTADEATPQLLRRPFALPPLATAPEAIQAPVAISFDPPNLTEDWFGRPTLYNRALPSNGVWNYGDGSTSTQKHPVHGYKAAGTYQLSLTDLDSHETYTAPVVVSPADTLRLNPFPIQISIPSDFYRVRAIAYDPPTKRYAMGQASPNSFGFGSFSFPDITGDRSNLEVAVKAVDGHPVNFHDWFFRGVASGLKIGLQVQQESTGFSKHYYTDFGSLRGGFDIKGFDNPVFPTIDSITPSSGPVGTTIHIVGDHLIGGMRTGPFFLDPHTGFPLPWDDYPLCELACGHDAASGKDYIDVVATLGRSTRCTDLTSPLALHIALTYFNFLGQSPEFILLPGAACLVPSLEGVSPTHGPAGTPVTLTGLNLGVPGTQLKFSKRARAPILIQTQTSIQTQVPSKAITGPLTVSNPFGEARSSFVFTVDAATTPTETPTSPPGSTPTPTPTSAGATPTPTPTPTGAGATSTPTPTPTPTPLPPTNTPTKTPTPAAGAPTISTLFNSTAHIGDHVEGEGTNLSGATFTINGVMQHFNFGDNLSFDITIVTGTATGKVCATNSFGTGCSEALLVID